MRDRNRASGLVYALGALSAAAIVAAFLVVGPPSQSATLQSRVVTASEGVVQSTVSGSGNLQADSQLDLGFKTAGVVQRIYVSQGQQVTTGKLLAELDPQTAEVALEQAKATLQAAEATLAQEEESGGETSSSAGSGASARTASVDASAASFSTVASRSASAAVGATQPGATAPPSTTPAPSTAPAAGTTPAASTTPAATTPAATTTPAASTTPAATAPASTRKPSTGTQTPTGTAASPAAAATSGSSEKAKQSAATKEANLASAKAAVRSDKLAVQSGEQAVANTKLYAPQAGTIVSLTGEVGETVSGTGTSRSTTTSSSSSTGSGSSTAGAAGAQTGRGASSSSSGSTDTSASGSPFAVLSDLSGMQLVVPLSESEVVHVHEGQPATVTIEALEGMKLAAHVASVATLSSSNSGVVSYDVTFQLDQMTSGMRPGMSASAEVVVKQEEGVNVPTSAITAGSVTVQEGSRQVRRRVVTGLAGNSTTIILSGLKAGERVLVPVSSSSSATSLLSRLAGRGAGGLGGRGGAGGLFGGGLARAAGG